MKITVKDGDDASKMLEYFNLFHDAFIKRFVVASRDRFSSPGRGEMIRWDININKRYRVRIDFAHHNYKAGGEPDRIVRASFSNSKDILFDLSSPPESGVRSIDRIEIVPGTAQRLDLVVVWNVAVVRDWKQVRSKILSFENAVFREA